MKEKLKKNIIARINAMNDEDQMLRAMQQLGLELDESIFTDFVWATIKDPEELPYLNDDKQMHLLTNKQTEKYREQTKGIKLFLVDDWYVNRSFNLKLRPEWINIITI